MSVLLSTAVKPANVRHMLTGLAAAAIACSPAPDRGASDMAAAEADTAQPHARGREGDTLLVFLHHIKPGSQKEYEVLMTEIWGSALRKAAAAGKEDWQYTMTATRDLVPLSAVPNDSSPTYVYLIDPAPPNFLSDSGSFPQALLMDAGYSRDQADSIAKKLDGTIRDVQFYSPVQHTFSRRGQ
jgi:hypothetical protein